jgi:hypothetical protein
LLKKKVLSQHSDEKGHAPASVGCIDPKRAVLDLKAEGSTPDREVKVDWD